MNTLSNIVLNPFSSFHLEHINQISFDILKNDLINDLNVGFEV